MAFQFDQRYPLGVTSDQYHTLVYQQIPVYIPRKKFYVADIFIYHVQQKLEDNMPILGQCFTMVNDIMFFFPLCYFLKPYFHSQGQNRVIHKNLVVLDPIPTRSLSRIFEQCINSERAVGNLFECLDPAHSHCCHLPFFQQSLFSLSLCLQCLFPSLSSTQVVGSPLLKLILLSP